LGADLFRLAVLGAQREATVTAEQASLPDVVVLVHEWLAAHEHVREDAAYRPHIHRLVIELLDENYFRWAIPSRYDVIGYLALSFAIDLSFI